ncbi:sulfhydry1 oxidase Erv1 like protein [Dasineura jujubifolia toursvirus 2a]|nr:sulfhydry1 oxidase Erv1 like protein [Dasineura jujubifolia toursvirus 2a]
MSQQFYYNGRKVLLGGQTNQSIDIHNTNDNLENQLEDTIGVSPAIWGPHYWYVIHTFANSYPNNPNPIEKEVATNFIKILPFILPCADCSRHAYIYIKTFYNVIPAIVANKSNIVEFFRTFHNNVNERLNKPRYY